MILWTLLFVGINVLRKSLIFQNITSRCSLALSQPLKEILSQVFNKLSFFQNQWNYYFLTEIILDRVYFQTNLGALQNAKMTIHVINLPVGNLKQDSGSSLLMMFSRFCVKSFPGVLGSQSGQNSLNRHSPSVYHSKVINSKSSLRERHGQRKRDEICTYICVFV